MALLRINRQPSRPQLLVFALAWLAVAGAVALKAATGGHGLLAVVAGIAALAVPVLWAVAPNGVRLIFLGLSYATYPLGFVVSYLVLAILFYGVFTPVGWIMRRSGRDPLARRFQSDAPTYWHPRPPPPPVTRYFRQR